ncbi:MAG: UDP-3-O-(3-hydroxymyristoyl)glucosamine N-acyltransferase [Gammaproteobacteria bacterium]|nr:UDP-3-O-(3-hydroxymyristoyl)glucosamine N-acyltransferase [Pseudomonadales bacterium]MCP5346414.1 UDP-3-O-(3-hydroxymyristoyl)glucosamine N-acyltransferase [Pseudomonadales bacterium]
MNEAKSYTLGTLADLLEVRLEGDGDCRIDGLATLSQGHPGKLSFLSNPAYVHQLADCRASAVILEEKFAAACPVNKLISAAPYLTFARATRLFDNTSVSSWGIHSSAVVHPTAELGEGVSIGPNAVIEAGVRLGVNCSVGAGSFVGENCRLGDNCRLHSNVTLYHGVTFGANVIIHSGAVIGADGFGFAFDGEKSVKIHQLGSVHIGDDVEVGAGSTIDRGAIEDTIIEQGVKIDNQVQIGHNCRIGAHTVICGCTAIAGSAVIGRYCVLGGASGVVGHISIGDRVRVGAMSLVSQSISEAGDYASGTGIDSTARWRRNIVRFSQLDELARRLRKLESKAQSPGETGRKQSEE